MRPQWLIADLVLLNVNAVLQVWFIHLILSTRRKNLQPVHQRLQQASVLGFHLSKLPIIFNSFMTKSQNSVSSSLQD